MHDYPNRTDADDSNVPSGPSELYNKTLAKWGYSIRKPFAICIKESIDILPLVQYNPYP